MRIGIDARLTYYSQAGISRYIQRLVQELPRLDPAVEWTTIQSRKDPRTLAGGRRVNGHLQPIELNVSRSHKITCTVNAPAPDAH